MSRLDTLISELCPHGVAFGKLGSYCALEKGATPIQKAVADYYGITVEMLKGKKRSNNIAYPRMVAMYLCRMLTDQSFPRIGLEFGGRDHSTVIHGVDKIEDDLKSNKELKNILDEIKKKL